MPVPTYSRFLKELGFHIRAGYTGILVVTEEHERLLQEVEALATNYLNKETKGGEKWNLYRWTVTDGWMFKGKKMPKSADEPPTPIADFLKIEKFDPFSIIVMENFHFFLTRENPDLIQAVRDLSKHCQKTNKCVIFANAVLDFPTELEAYITVLDHELPTPDDIDGAINMISESVDRHGVKIPLPEDKRYVVRESLKGMRLGDVENALAYSIVTAGGFEPKILLAEKCKAIKKTGLLSYLQSEESFEKIGGLERLKKWLGLWKIAFTDKAKKFNLSTPRGVLLLGVPGCGKTLIALATAEEFKLPLIRFDMANVFGRYVGDSEQNMRRALKTVDAVAPCVLFIDEIEKGAAGASAGNSTDGGTSPRVYGEFLKWQNDHQTSVFTIATANDIRSIPLEYLRKGRFDEIFFVDIPSGSERADIFRKQFGRQKLDFSKYDLNVLLEGSNQFTGAEIAYAISMAKLVAANRNQLPSTEDILGVLKDVQPEATKNKERIQAIRARAGEVAVPASYDEKADPTGVQTKDGKWRGIV